MTIGPFAGAVYTGTLEVEVPALTGVGIEVVPNGVKALRFNPFGQSYGPSDGGTAVFVNGVLDRFQRVDFAPVVPDETAPRSFGFSAGFPNPGFTEGRNWGYLNPATVIDGFGTYTLTELGGGESVWWTPGSGSWSFSSDRRIKEGVTPLDTLEVLDRVARLPITQWRYAGYTDLHIGPMAQDFHALFPLNGSQTSLNSVDLHGVTLAAVQGLNLKLAEEVRRKDDAIRDLQAAVAELRDTVRRMGGNRP